jgi:hypothetical protein
MTLPFEKFEEMLQIGKNLVKQIYGSLPFGKPTGRAGWDGPTKETPSKPSVRGELVEP